MKKVLESISEHVKLQLISVRLRYLYALFDLHH